MSTQVSGNLYEMGEDFTGGPEGPNLSLLAHCLTIAKYGGCAVEFGVGSGRTTRMIAKHMPVIGFDSFKGLPEDWRPDFPAGRFSEYDMPRDIAGATIVPGWFTDTAVGYDWPDDIHLIHMDADLYSSTWTALTSLKGFIRYGCIIVFDEFHGITDDLDGQVPGEQRAWREFADKWGYTWDVIGFGREQWALRIK